MSQARPGRYLGTGGFSVVARVRPLVDADGNLAEEDRGGVDVDETLEGGTDPERPWPCERCLGARATGRSRGALVSVTVPERDHWRGARGGDAACAALGEGRGAEAGAETGGVHASRGGEARSLGGETLLLLKRGGANDAVTG